MTLQEILRGFKMSQEWKRAVDRRKEQETKRKIDAIMFFEKVILSTMSEKELEDFKRKSIEERIKYMDKILNEEKIVHKYD